MNDRLIIPLDVSRLSPALELTRKLGDEVRWVKVGLQLFTGTGPDAMQSLKSLGKRLFLDLKLHDIPNTVAGAVESAAHWHAELLTLHAAGGPAMMRAAREARDRSNQRAMKLVAATVLTSLDGSEYPEVYRDSDVRSRVLAFAHGAAEAGLDGVVCSVHELEALHASGLPKDFLYITPGIRPAGSPVQDQARIATPREALAKGATHLVVGRPITQAEDPAAAARAVLEDMQGA